MLTRVQSLVEELCAAVASMQPGDLSGTEARALVESFVALERAAGAGKTLAIARVEETGSWVGDGSFRDLPTWLSSLTRTSFGANRATVDTAIRLRELPVTSNALREGALSPAQAEVVSAAAWRDRDAEGHLLSRAATAGMKGLRQECDRVVAAARSADGERLQAECAHRERTLRHHPGDDGTGRIVIRGPLDRTAQMMAALEPIERELFEDLRRAGAPEHPDTIAFDAMVQLCAHEAEPAKPSARGRRKGGRPLGVVNLFVSLDAYLRGFTKPGEICEIEGAGPVAVSTAYRIAADSVLRAIVVDGVDVCRVSHLGRSIPAHLRTAVEARDRGCVIAGCEVDRHLEIDHNDPVAALGPTELANLGRLCHHHHDLKTRRDLRRVGPLGEQRLVSRREFEVARGVDRGPPIVAAV